MPPVSVLDVSPVPAGVPEAQALRNTIDLARHAEALGYHRYWLAEHHGGGMVASSSPEVMIGAVAAATSTIRVGAGGIMLPNHSPLRVAEHFKVLEALHPGRIDLGLGRAPGTDQLTALALRRSREAMSADDFTEQLAELLRFGGAVPWPEGHPFGHIAAAPVEVALPPITLLGSSDYSAQVAAVNGLAFAYAAHIGPMAAEALTLYRERFVPSAWQARPHAILAHAVVCAQTDEEARRLAASSKLAMQRLREGRPGPLPEPDEAIAQLGEVPAAAPRPGGGGGVAGSPVTVRERLDEMLRSSQADELMVMTNVHDHGARRRSYELIAEAFRMGTSATSSPDATSAAPASASTVISSS